MLCIYVVSNAQTVLATWPFTSSSTAATGVASNMTAANAAFSSTTTAQFNGGSVYFGEGGWPSANAIDVTVYLQFSVAPASGYILNLSALDLGMRRSTTGGASGPSSWSVRSSLDNYATDVASGTNLSNSATPATVVSLGTAFNNINSTVTFRVYGYNASVGSGGSNRFVFESMDVKGTTYAISAINFRSKTTGNFTDVASWEYSTSGSTYSDATQTPTSTNITYIKSGTTVMVANDLSIASGKNITVDGVLNMGGYKITGAGNVIVNGTVQTSNTGGLATVFSNTGTITLTAGASYIFNGATTTPFPTSVSSVVAKDITTSANVTLNKTATVSGTLYVTGGTLTTSNNLTLISTSSATARIDALGSGATISGNITVQKYVPGGRRAYRFMAHPFASSIALTAITDNIDVTGTGGSANGFTTTGTNNASSFWYDPTTGNGSTTSDIGWTDFTNTNGAGANAWKQYAGALVLVRGAKGEGLTGATYTPSPVTIDMAGAVNTGTQTITLTKGTNSPYNFIGNPYPSQIDLSTTTRGSSVGANFWVWDANQGTKGAYTSQPFSTSYILPAYSSIIVQTSANTNNTIQFTESSKSSSTTSASLYRSANASFQNTLHLRLESDSIFWDRLLVVYNDNSTSAIDDADALKFVNSDVNFYSISSDKKNLSIDARNIIKEDTIALGLQTNLARTFTLRVADMTVPSNMEIYLHDKYLDVMQKLEDGGTYMFNTTSDAGSQGETRFELLSKKIQTLLVQGSNSLSVKIAPNPATEKFVLSLGNNTQLNGVIAITNISGQVVKTMNVTNASSATIAVKDLAKGVYYVTYNNGKDKLAQKVEVQ